MANVNERIVSPPRKKMHSSTSRVENDVITVRLKVWFSERLKVVRRSSFG